jgi:hypothetical protein
MSLGRAAIALAAIAIVSHSTSADAQTFGPDMRSRYESHQNFAFELRFGPYVAAIDSEFHSGNGYTATPYQDYFGGPNPCAGTVTADRSTHAYHCPNPRIMAGLEFDWQAVRLGPVGSLGLGLGVSGVGVTDGAPTTASMTAGNVAVTDPSLWTRSSESTSLYVIPITMQAVVRFDGIARRYRYIPFVPYLKVGLAYAFWWITKGPSTATQPTSNGGTQQAIGGSLGWNAAVGLSLLLDVFEPRLAREFDATQGVNHSYLFVEANMMDLSGFTGRHQLNVGTSAWNVGLSTIAWTVGLALEF